MFGNNNNNGNKSGFQNSSNTTENITSKLDSSNGSGKNEYNINIDLASFLEEFEKIANIKAQYQEEKKESKYVMTEEELYSEIANYDMNYSVRELAVICEYYGFDTFENLNNMEKLELVERIMIFENKRENMIEVYRRKQNWSYLEDLKADSYFKKFIIDF
jgi:intein/homing endonuclease